MDCYYIKEHLYQILNSYTFKCHSYEDLPLLPSQQHFHRNKYHSGLLLPQGTCILNMKFVSLQTAKISRYVSVAMVTECPWQQVRAWIAVPSKDLCCKYEVHLCVSQFQLGTSSRATPRDKLKKICPGDQDLTFAGRRFCGIQSETFCPCVGFISDKYAVS